MRHPNQMRFIIFYSLAFVIGTNFLTNSIALGVSLGFATIDSPRIFGEQRVWGTIGFGISAFAASRLYKIFQTEFVYIIMFIITTMLCVIITSFIRVQEKKQNEIEEKEMDDFTIMKTKKPSPFALSAFFPLLKQLDVIVFLSLAFIWGMSYAVLDPVGQCFSSVKNISSFHF
jgi:fucose permease